MKKVLIILLSLVLLTGIGYGVFRSCSKKNDTVKMGVVLPLSGNSAIIGEPKKRAFDIAMEQYNLDGKKRLEVFFEDSQGTASGGTSAFNKLLLNKDIDCYYIDLTPIVNACVPQVNSKKVITFAGSAEPEVTNLSDYLFRLFAGGDQEIELMVNYLKNESIDSVFVLHTNELYGVNALKYFKVMFENGGGVIIGEDEYPMNNGDFKAQLLKAKDSNPDKILLLGYGNEYPTLLKQAIEFGLAPDMFVCNLGGSNKSVMELPGMFTEGMAFIGPRFSYLLDNNILEPEMKGFVELYQAKYNDIPDFRAAYAYDMVNIFMNVYGDGTKTAQQIVEELKTIKEFKGASGVVSFKENGDTETDLVTAKYVDGSMVLIVR